jgi:hypothetical protein
MPCRQITKCQRKKKFGGLGLNCPLNVWLNDIAKGLGPSTSFLHLYYYYYYSKKILLLERKGDTFSTYKN